MPFGLGIWEIVILVVVLALLFGAKGLPDAAKRMGKGVREIQGAMGDLDPRKALEAPKPTPKQPAAPKPAVTATQQQPDEPDAT
jgi:sec-independent protein translocase protein TatA